MNKRTVFDTQTARDHKDSPFVRSDMFEEADSRQYKESIQRRIVDRERLRAIERRRNVG